MKLAKALHFDLPDIDPSLYLERFCNDLEFEEKKDEVKMMATKVLKSMKHN